MCSVEGKMITSEITTEKIAKGMVETIVIGEMVSSAEEQQ